MRILIGLAAGVLATAAFAQTSTTTETNSMGTMGTMAMPDKATATKSTTATHESKSMHSTMSGKGAMHSHRKCQTHMRHGKKVRVCKTQHMM